MVDVVQQYLARVRAYNGVASMLVTETGAPVAEAAGAVRAGAALKFPTQTVMASTILPDLDQYQGPPLEYGRMEPTKSDPAVQQQFGMIAGVPNAGQLNALAESIAALLKTLPGAQDVLTVKNEGVQYYTVEIDRLAAASRAFEQVMGQSFPALLSHLKTPSC